MKRIYAAGIVVCYKSEFGIEYLLIRHSIGGHWDFPKGRLEEGETDREAALRELAEETNIKYVEIIDDFFTTISYTPIYENERVHKTVQFFIGWVQNKAVHLSHEHDAYMWLSYDDALKQLSYDRSRGVLHKVHMYNAY